MEINDQRPGAALINAEWYRAARSVVSVQELGLILVNAVDYVLTGAYDIKLQPTAAAVFAMIKPSLDSDIVKYRERCARNAANAKSRFERVAASGSESQRVDANTTTTTTSTTTSTPISLKSETRREIEIDEEFEKWVVFGYFWSVGNGAPSEECKAFWSYYESLGWKNNKGAAIVSKLAAARMWRPQFDLKEPKTGAGTWFNVMIKTIQPRYDVFTAYMGAERVDGKVLVHLHGSAEQIAAFTGENTGIFPALCKAWKVSSVEIIPS